MVGLGSKGNWGASSVTEDAILELKSASYLPANVTHRVPEEGQVVPTPRPGERVMFLTHFIQGLDLIPLVSHIAAAIHPDPIPPFIFLPNLATAGLSPSSPLPSHLVPISLPHDVERLGAKTKSPKPNPLPLPSSSIPWPPPPSSPPTPGFPASDLAALLPHRCRPPSRPSPPSLSSLGCCATVEQNPRRTTTGSSSTARAAHPLPHPASSEPAPHSSLLICAGLRRLQREGRGAVRARRGVLRRGRRRREGAPPRAPQGRPAPRQDPPSPLGIHRLDDAPHMFQLGYNLLYLVQRPWLSTASSTASSPMSPSPTTSSLFCSAVEVPCSVPMHHIFFIKCSSELDSYISWLLFLKLFVHL
nr:WAS/WASL-interacting protein family member 1-like [Aegilops tauschii subsp. strangulata]